MKKFITFLFFLLILCVAVFAGSPYYTAYQLKNAYDAKDGAAIANQIDYDSLRPNIQSQLNTKFANTLSDYPMVAQLGGTALTQAADEFIDRSVEGAITPQNIERIITTQGQANQATKELAAAWAIASNQVNLQNLIQDLIIQRGDIDAVVKNQMQIMMDKQAETLEAHVAQGEDSNKPQLNYCGINCFAISGNVKGYPVTVEMQRQGLIEWKIVNVVLP
ncbi:DUF2939 domain-containing protein [Psychrobacter sp. I-STPA10]|uniref:DUF2939 domain-containing protein n=1 Tax=Psychrobacter sp. I-STPA10 TaxID=2585769 RepID=UPI001E4D9A51|nr:DUF2939 domain-containing protein [Psychrobacter sp. I-STPA10]